MTTQPIRHAFVSYDTLAVSKRLKAKNLPQEAAEAIAEEMKACSDAALGDLITQGDLKLATTEIRAEMAALKGELKAEIAGNRTEIANAKNTIILFAIGQFAAIIAVLLKLFNVL